MKPGKNDQQEQFIELRAAGHSYGDIAKEMDVSKTTLIAWAKRLELEIQNARALRLDELFERFAMSKEKRVETFGKLLKNILAELDQRDLGKVKTETLLALALKFGDALRAEHQPLILKGEDVAPSLGLDSLSVVRSWYG